MNSLTENSFTVKITGLWTVFLLGTLFHTQLALMPLFHGMGVAESHTHNFASVDAVMWFMLLFFSLPLLAIIGCVFLTSRRFRLLHFVTTVVYTILNLLHLVIDTLIAAPSYQLALMTLLLLVGLLVNVVSYQWIKIDSRAASKLKFLR